ncbi:MAG TPA: Crp/Fnr family transcriptional regulator [Gammaproteobacteria bacterium]|nr:Crp/Fnr family transcriptional regulator [Gammaproteobacteria bacterium]
MNTDSLLFPNYRTQLEQSRLFKGVGDKSMTDILSRCYQTTWRKGVVSDGSGFVEKFYLIIDGRVKLERTDPASGDKITIFLLGPGDGFDVIPLLDGQRHEATATAVDDLSMLCASTESVRQWINQYPEFNRNFLPYLGNRMREIEDLSADIALKHTITRLARLILRHTVTDGHPDQGPHAVKLIHDLTHDALAQMIGSTRQVVNRHLQLLRREGVLDSKSRHLAVLELEALKKQAEMFLSSHHHK